jgi:hypothetical protein
MDFDTALEFDLNEELAKGQRRIQLGPLFEPDDNQPPAKPEAPTGEIEGTPGVDYAFKAVKTDDPNGDRTMYLFDWGDGTQSHWIHPSQFGWIKATHNWTDRGTYEVKVKAMDIYGRESDWSEPAVISMPKNKRININPLIIQFLENHPHLFPILRKILLYPR